MANIRSRPTRANLYRWQYPGPDFARSAEPKADDIISAGPKSRFGARERPKVVDGVSCRQIFLRSYPLLREDNVRERTKAERFRRCVIALFRFKEAKGKTRRTRRKSCLVVVRRARKASFAAFSAVFSRILSCASNGF